MKPHIFIISGPSGVGKGTIVSSILQNHPDFVVPDSYTTRHKREIEKTFKKYIFIDKPSFMELAKSGEILEWEEVHGRLYGTSRKSLDKALANNQNVLMEIDVKGSQNIKKFIPQAILIFIKYESADHLAKAIRNRIQNDPTRRGTSEVEIQTRIKTAQAEMNYKKYYPYAITNPEGHPEKAIEEVEKIILKEIKNER